ncbi:transcription-repair coupling factor [Peptoniphilus sp. oral taxon 386]|uniref:transcription-repair coupling factor n=1 Tax=Peptoniphilus sp. oral taxon 386 TaxID=652713 RepID=UPI0001DA9DF9|nr:transcription-repair coupling factor [Peptoniphilus sp. oral taxon 386]EFI41468.1 transcription-repair coupling factor [Peptoniphilus sp. oral taxon 386 str. F0131]
MNFLIDSVKNMSGFKDILSSIKNDITPIGVYGITDGQIGHMAFSILSEIKKPILIIAPDNLKARKIYEDLLNLGIKDCDLYPKREIFLYDRDSKSLDNIKIRIRAMQNLAMNRNRVLVATTEALRDKIADREVFKKYILNITCSDELDIKLLEKNLITMGYERRSQVEGVGQFAIRGAIIDIYTPISPYRIELFDVEVDSIRSFDIATQRSIENLTDVEIGPVSDFLLLDEYRQTILKNLNAELKKSKLSGNYRERLNEKFSKYINSLTENLTIANMDLIMPFVEEEKLNSIIDYYNEQPIILIDEPNRCIDRARVLEVEQKDNLSEQINFGEALKAHEKVQFDLNKTILKIKELSIITLNTLTVESKEFSPRVIVNFRMKSITNYRGKMKLFVDDLKDYTYRGYKVVILAGNDNKAKRLCNTLIDFGLTVRYEEHFEAQIKSSEIIVTTGTLHDGFEISDIKFVIINYSEIYGLKEVKRKPKKKNKVINFEDLNIGDYVVHEVHGIGKYIGTKRLEVQNVKKDYIVIEYKGEDKLFLPIESLNLIYKYVGSEGKAPKVNKLNSLEWSKTKSKAKKSVEDMAEDLIKLYAKRQEVKGFAFSEDTQWQREFEDAFEYEETQGQLESSEEIKNDMQSDKPMDRLLCADVGYGKTEVAIRAAFKAIMDGKQVAFLVPTTILAQQHYNTMIERFKDFPVKIALLCRFRSKMQQKKDLEDLKKGFVDIIIGTHRILSKDVVFKDLGLLVIDEEQRFGVRHKEKLKILKENVDTLTLTATPIPRTLQMSMVGIRDMSVIEEPPEERFPVQTYVLEYNDMMIREAILKEIERGGQVYFVYNKVANIENKLIELRNLVPEAKFNIAHGQMSEQLLEDTMISFINHEFDVLLCSTIIETGMDIQNANTIIVSDANRLGLSQLYQLRGRIGRSNKIAYAYFTYGRDISLSEIAQKRLKSIKEFTEFGSGYKIALRDLEIRGSGSILGSRQHGHIDSIGYDLYIKYLRDTLSKMKGEEVKEEDDTTIDVKVDSYIPASYIEDENNRIEIYKKIATIESDDDYSDLVDELIDRFSDIPYQVSNLMDISLIRYMAREVGVKSITQKKDEYEFKLSYLPNLELINELSDSFKKISFNLGSEPGFTVNNLKYPLDELKRAIEIIKLHKKLTPNTEN